MDDLERKLLACEAALDQAIAMTAERRGNGNWSVFDIYKQLMDTRPEDAIEPAVFMMALCIDRLAGDATKKAHLQKEK
jgi:hypothetical protein